MRENTLRVFLRLRELMCIRCEHKCADRLDLMCIEDCILYAIEDSDISGATEEIDFSKYNLT